MCGFTPWIEQKPVFWYNREMYQNKTSKAIAVVMAVLIPLSAQAAVLLSVESPVIAGLGTQVRVSGLTPSQSAHISVLPAAGEEILIPIQADSKGEAKQELRAQELQRAGSYHIGVEANGQSLTARQTFTVQPDTVDIRHSTVRALSNALIPDGRDTADVVVTLRDRYDNPLPGRPVTLLSSRALDDISAQSQQTDIRGELHFIVSTTIAGTMSLRALDLLSGNALTESATINAGNAAIGGERMAYAAPAISNSAQLYRMSTTPSNRMFYAQMSGFDVIDGFEIIAPASLPSGEEAQLITVRAVDRSGNTVEDYVGSIVFSSTDPQATLPNFGEYTFKERDLGEKEFPLVLKFERSGIQTLRVEDQNDPSILGETTIDVAGDAHNAAATITVTSHTSGDTVSTTNIVLEGIGPKFANLIVSGGVSDVTGATDKDGNFSIPVSLNPQTRNFTLRVRDDASRNDSGPIDLILDTEKPSIGTITFSPEHPNTSDKVLIVVQAEPKLSSLVMHWQPKPTAGGEDVMLIENPTATGSYQAFFTAPEQGAYQPMIEATDSADNTAEVRTSFVVGSSLSTVQNLRGEVRTNAAALEWDAVGEQVDGYRIYVGEKPDNFLYTLDTGRVTTKVTVAGLVPGRTYYFAATAVRGKEESAAKSTVLKLDIPGLVLTVTPSNGSLLLEWTPPKVSLQSYMLEYGVREATYTEKRIIPAKKADDGKPQAFTVSDLINGVTYFLRLTPITITGDALTDLAASGKGTPVENGLGFQPTPGDPIPFNPGQEALKHTPTNATTGLPAPVWFGIAALVLGACAYQWHRRRALRHSAAFLASIRSQYERRT